MEVFNKAQIAILEDRGAANVDFYQLRQKEP